METASLPFWLVSGFLLFGLISLFSLTIRYFILGVVPFFILKNKKIENFLKNRLVYLNSKKPTLNQFKSEFLNSLLSLFIFSIVSMYIYWGYHSGWVKLYFKVSDYGWAYYFFILAALLLIQDLWFYLVHRMLHMKIFFKWAHRTHHLSQHTTPLTAFSFDPFEAFMHALIAVVAYSWFPVHPTHFIIFQFIMNLQNMYVHSGYEWFPSSWIKSGRIILNTATDHHQHHSKFNVNFGIYTTVWDRLFGTYQR